MYVIPYFNNNTTIHDEIITKLVHYKILARGQGGSENLINKIILKIL